MVTERRSRQDDDVGTEPTPLANADRRLDWPLPTNGFVGVGVGVVLIGDVDVGAGLDIVTEFDRPVPDDVAPSSDDAPLPDGHDGVGHHLLPRRHPCSQADVRPNEGSITDGEVVLVVDRPLWPENRRPVTEVGELATDRVLWTDGTEVECGAASEAHQPTEAVAHRSRKPSKPRHAHRVVRSGRDLSRHCSRLGAALSVQIT